MTGVTYRYGSGMASTDGAGGRFVLRTRIGVHLDDRGELGALQDRLADAISAELQAAHATVDLLQIGVAADPRWHVDGPPNRATSTDGAIKMSST
jgi:hypothetical protein